nr:hypothetical protein GCM10010200_010360 [Actinomadura rugatobispora]
MLTAAVAVPLALAGPAHAAPERTAPFPYPDAELTLVNHRGLSPGFPENTLAAFRNSIAMGVDAIEIDLRLTKDGQIVILHDDTVDRTTDGTGRIGDLTLAQVKALDAGGHAGEEFAGERVPTYTETLEAVKGSGVRLLLDIKDASRVPEIVRITQEHGMASQVIVGPRTVQALGEFKRLDPGLTTLGFIATAADAGAFIDAGVDYIRLWPEWITASRDTTECKADYAARVAAYQRGERSHPGSASCAVEDVVSRGTPVWSTTNDAGYEAMDELLGLGATGLLSDVPAVLKQLLDDIDAKRFTTAAPQIAELRAHVKADRKDRHDRALKQVEKNLNQARKYVRARDAGRACGALHEASRAGSGYAGDIASVRFTLACSRFA